MAFRSNRRVTNDVSEVNAPDQMTRIWLPLRFNIISDEHERNVWSEIESKLFP